MKRRSVLFLTMTFCSSSLHAFAPRILQTTTSTRISNDSLKDVKVQKETRRLVIRQSNAIEETTLSHSTEAGRIASSFAPRTFDPLLSNRHVQTILSFATRHIPEFLYVDTTKSRFEILFTLLSSLLDNLIIRTNPHPELANTHAAFWQHRERIETPDGDWFHVDYAYAKNEENAKNALVLILHGLESSSDSSLSIDMAKAYVHQNNMNVACLNFRGCSGTPNDTLGGYHLGFTDDLLHYLQILKERHGHSTDIFITGFSLGGNVVLKALGDLGEAAAVDYNIQGAAALCAPLDPARNAPFFCQRGFNKAVYNENLLRTMRKTCQDQLDRHCDGNVDTRRFDYRRAMSAKTITDFDNAFVAPIYGYKDAAEYYDDTSSARVLEQIAVPTFVLNARDDPFMDPSYLPLEKTQEGGGKAPVKLCGTPHGGHLGYILHKVEGTEEMTGTGFASTEMARFLRHVQNARVDANEE